MIEAQNLTKMFGTFTAVRNVSFTIPTGQITAFLGPNGAGKTTTMRLLTGYLAPTSGVAKICGFDVASKRIEAAKSLGYLPENGPLYEDMTPRELLYYMGEARGMSSFALVERIGTLTDLCALKQIIDKPIYKLSRGNRQRVGMAQALLHDPQVLIMDEPTAGLDPNQIRVVRDTIKELGKNKTIMLSTHILQEVEAIADRVLFINRGEIIFDGTPAEMHKKGDNLEEVFYQLTNPVERGEEI